MTESEVKVEVLMEEMKLFNVPKRIRGLLKGLEKEFTDYHIDNVTIGVEAGIPSGIKGSVQVALKKK